MALRCRTPNFSTELKSNGFAFTYFLTPYLLYHFPRSLAVFALTNLKPVKALTHTADELDVYLLMCNR